MSVVRLVIYRYTQSCKFTTDLQSHAFKTLKPFLTVLYIKKIHWGYTEFIAGDEVILHNVKFCRRWLHTTCSLMFPDHDYTSLYVGTLTASFEDCTALSSVYYVAKHLHQDHNYLFQLAFHPKVQEDVRILKPGEEVRLKGSYFPYCRSMSIIY